MNKLLLQPRTFPKLIRSALIGSLLLVACDHHSAPAQTGPSSPVAPEVKGQSSPLDQNREQALSNSDAVRVATEWLGALRARDRVGLTKLADVPFELEELVEHPKCEAKRAEHREDVPGALDCLLSDDLLMETLASQPAPVTEVVRAGDLPPWAAKLKERSSKDQLVQIRLPGDGVSYQFLILSTTLGVKRVWKFAEYDPN